MEPALAALFSRVKDRVSEEEFLRRVREAGVEFDGLLDDEALGLLVLDELGLNEGAYVTLAELEGRAEATVRVVVERVDPPRTFDRGGREGRVCNVHVSDATGAARVVLWDRDVDKAEDGTLRAGARVTLVNARVKQGPYGPELHVGPWSVLEVEGALDPARRKLLADVGQGPDVLSSAGASDADVQDAPEPKVPRQTRLPEEDPVTAIEGRLAWVGPTRPVRRDGATAFACDVDLETEKGVLRVVAWDAAVKAVRATPVGSRVALDALEPKVRGARTEWHTTAATRVASA